MDIFIGKNGRQEGPYPSEEVQSRLADGRLSPEDLAWVPGMRAWRPLGAFLAERGLAPQSAPPPLPGHEIAGGARESWRRVSRNAEYEALAHAMLKDRYGMTFLASFLSGVLEGLPGMVPFIGGILRLVLSPVFRLGMLVYFMKRARPAGPEPDFNDLFAAFNFFGRALGAFWYRVLWVFLGSLPGITLIAIAAVLGVAADGRHEPFAVAALVLGIAGAVTLVTTMLVLGYRYALHLYLCLDNPGMPVAACLEESVRLMSGHKWRLFCQQLYLVWKPALAFLLIVLAFVAGLAAFVDAHQNSGAASPREGLGEFAMVFAGLSIFALINLPVIYFLVRAQLRAAVAHVRFYDELAHLDRPRARAVSAPGACSPGE